MLGTTFPLTIETLCQNGSAIKCSPLSRQSKSLNNALSYVLNLFSGSSGCWMPKLPKLDQKYQKSTLRWRSKTFTANFYWNSYDSWFIWPINCRRWIFLNHTYSYPKLWNSSRHATKCTPPSGFQMTVAGIMIYLTSDKARSSVKKWHFLVPS